MKKVKEFLRRLLQGREDGAQSTGACTEEHSIQSSKESSRGSTDHSIDCSRLNVEKDFNEYLAPPVALGVSQTYKASSVLTAREVPLLRTASSGARSVSYIPRRSFTKRKYRDSTAAISTSGLNHRFTSGQASRDISPHRFPKDERSPSEEFLYVRPVAVTSKSAELRASGSKAQVATKGPEDFEEEMVAPFSGQKPKVSGSDAQTSFIRSCSSDSSIKATSREKDDVRFSVIRPQQRHFGNIETLSVPSLPDSVHKVLGPGPVICQEFSDATCRWQRTVAFPAQFIHSMHTQTSRSSFNEPGTPDESTSRKWALSKSHSSLDSTQAQDKHSKCNAVIQTVGDMHVLRSILKTHTKVEASVQNFKSENSVEMTGSLASKPVDRTSSVTARSFADIPLRFPSRISRSKSADGAHDDREATSQISALLKNSASLSVPEMAPGGSREGASHTYSIQSTKNALKKINSYSNPFELQAADKCVTARNQISAPSETSEARLETVKDIMIHSGTCSRDCSPLLDIASTNTNKIKFVVRRVQDGKVGLLLTPETSEPIQPILYPLDAGVDGQQRTGNENSPEEILATVHQISEQTPLALDLISQGVQTANFMPCVSWSNIPNNLSMTDTDGCPVSGARLELVHFPCPCHPLDELNRCKGSEKKVTFSEAHFPPVGDDASEYSTPTWPSDSGRTASPQKEGTSPKSMGLRSLAAIGGQGMFRTGRNSDFYPSSFAAPLASALLCYSSKPLAEGSVQNELDRQPFDRHRYKEEDFTSHDTGVPRTYDASDFTASNKRNFVEYLLGCLSDSKSAEDVPCGAPGPDICRGDSESSPIREPGSSSSTLTSQLTPTRSNETNSCEPTASCQDTLNPQRQTGAENCNDRVRDVNTSAPPSVGNLPVTQLPSESTDDPPVAKESSNSLQDYSTSPKPSCHSHRTTSLNDAVEPEAPTDLSNPRGMVKTSRQCRSRSLMTRRAPPRKFRESKRSANQKFASRDVPRRSPEFRAPGKRYAITDASATTSDDKVESLWINPWTQRSFPSSKSIIGISGEGCDLLWKSRDGEASVPNGQPETEPQKNLIENAVETRDASAITEKNDPPDLYQGTAHVASSSSGEEDADAGEHRQEKSDHQRPVGKTWSGKGTLGRIMGRAKEAAKSRAPFSLRGRRGPVTEPNISTFECSVCADYLAPPVRQCPAGHGLCPKCLKGAEDCVLCGKPMPTVPNKALDALARTVLYPCKNGTAGCKESYWIEDRARHESRCAYRPRPCPFASRSQVMCSWAGARTMIRGHMKRAHGHQGTVYSFRNFFPLEEFNIAAWVGRTYDVEIVFVEQEIFELHKVFDRRNTCLWGLLRHILAKDANAQFCYTIRFQPVNMRPSVAFRNDAVSGSEDLDRAFAMGKRFNLHLDCFTQNPLDIFSVQLKVQPWDANKWA